MFKQVFMQLLEDVFSDEKYNRKDSQGHYYGVRRRRGDTGPHNRKQSIGPSIGAKNQQQVPDHWKADASLHPAVEQLRNKPSGHKVLHKLDVKKIMDLYKIKNLTPEKPRQLSNCGIFLAYNHQLGKYTLVKK